MKPPHSDQSPLPDGVFDTGLFAQDRSRRSFRNSPCLFMDRDGVLVEETNYLHRVEDIVFIPDVAAAVARVNDAGLPVVLVTNQAGIGRGLYDWDAFALVQEAILRHLAGAGAHLDMVLACAFHGEGREPYRFADHPWRKPRPGMLRVAAQTLGVDLSRSFIVGDTIADLTAGQSAGLPAGALVLTGHGRRDYEERFSSAVARWRETGRFKALVSDNAAIAIRHWLARITGSTGES